MKLEQGENQGEDDHRCVEIDEFPWTDFAEMKMRKNNRYKAIDRHRGYQENRTVDCCVPDYSKCLPIILNVSPYQGVITNHLLLALG